MDLHLENFCLKHFVNSAKWTKRWKDMPQPLRIYYGNIMIMNALAKRYAKIFKFINMNHFNGSF